MNGWMDGPRVEEGERRCEEAAGVARPTTSFPFLRSLGFCGFVVLCGVPYVFFFWPARRLLEHEWGSFALLCLFPMASVCEMVDIDLSVGRTDGQDRTLGHGGRTVYIYTISTPTLKLRTITK